MHRYFSFQQSKRHAQYLKNLEKDTALYSKNPTFTGFRSRRRYICWTCWKSEKIQYIGMFGSTVYRCKQILNVRRIHYILFISYK